ncbi:MAG: hypothetical protein FWB87_10825 [Defluviitaleaceae bacterium]|nr:hypothetical protein [Defluviitaleaceae bacterium]MCL2261981.1 hypothetical protein [Defluviitaleaceae bacterium]
MDDEKDLLRLEGDENKAAHAKQDDFEEWAFTITGIIVGFLLVGPELLYEFTDIPIWARHLLGMSVTRCEYVYKPYTGLVCKACGYA